jgi:hypothetical protein
MGHRAKGGCPHTIFSARSLATSAGGRNARPATPINTLGMRLFRAARDRLLLAWLVVEAHASCNFPAILGLQHRVDEQARAVVFLQFAIITDRKALFALP